MCEALEQKRAGTGGGGSTATWACLCNVLCALCQPRDQRIGQPLRRHSHTARERLVFVTACEWAIAPDVSPQAPGQKACREGPKSCLNCGSPSPGLPAPCPPEAQQHYTKWTCGSLAARWPTEPSKIMQTGGRASSLKFKEVYTGVWVRIADDGGNRPRQRPLESGSTRYCTAS